MSHGTASDLRPSDSISAATSFSASALRAVTTTSAPACANAIDIARPSPRLAPVTKQTRPSSSDLLDASVIVRSQHPLPNSGSGSDLLQSEISHAEPETLNPTFLPV